MTENNKELTVEERLALLEEQVHALLTMVLQLAEGMADLSDVILNVVKDKAGKQQMN